MVLHMSAEMSRENSRNRPEQQNPSGQRQTSSCASEAVAARIAWGKRCSLNQILSKMLELSNPMLGESKTRKKNLFQNCRQSGCQFYIHRMTP